MIQDKYHVRLSIFEFFRGVQLRKDGLIVRPKIRQAFSSNRKNSSELKLHAICFIRTMFIRTLRLKNAYFLRTSQLFYQQLSLSLLSLRSKSRRSYNRKCMYCILFAGYSHSGIHISFPVVLCRFHPILAEKKIAQRTDGLTERQTLIKKCVDTSNKTYYSL